MSRESASLNGRLGSAQPTRVGFTARDANRPTRRLRCAAMRRRTGRHVPNADRGPSKYELEGPRVRAARSARRWRTGTSLSLGMTPARPRHPAAKATGTRSRSAPPDRARVVPLPRHRQPLRLQANLSSQNPGELPRPDRSTGLSTVRLPSTRPVPQGFPWLPGPGWGVVKRVLSGFEAAAQGVVRNSCRE